MVCVMLGGGAGSRESYQLLRQSEAVASLFHHKLLTGNTETSEMHGSDISQLEAPNEVSFSTKQQPRSEELFVRQFAQT